MAEHEGGEDLYSMQELEKDLKGVKGGRRAVWFLIGLALGVAGTLLLPPLLGPYLPAALRGGGEPLTGLILEEEREGDRLLLTVDADRGALIASFTQRVAEIGLLVEPGDSLTLDVSDYEPFLEDPHIGGIRKARPGPGRPTIPADTGAATGGEETAPRGADSVPGGAAGATADTSAGRGVRADSVEGTAAGEARTSPTASAALSGSRTPPSAPRRRT